MSSSDTGHTNDGVAALFGAGPASTAVAALDGELTAVLTFSVEVGSQRVHLEVEAPLAEIRARLGIGGSGGLVNRSPDWETSEVAKALGVSGYTLKTRLRKDEGLREIGGVYRRTKEKDGEPVEYGSYRFPAESLPAFIDAYNGVGPRLADGGSAADEAEEPPTPTPPASAERHPDLPDNLDSWEEELDE